MTIQKSPRQVTNLITNSVVDNEDLRVVHLDVSPDVDVHVRLNYSDGQGNNRPLCQVYLHLQDYRSESVGYKTKFLADLDLCDLPQFFVSSQVFMEYGRDTELFSAAGFINTNAQLYIYEWEHFKKCGIDLVKLEEYAPNLNLAEIDPTIELAVLLVCGKYTSYASVPVSAFFEYSR